MEGGGYEDLGGFQICMSTDLYVISLRYGNPTTTNTVTYSDPDTTNLDATYPDGSNCGFGRSLEKGWLVGVGLSRSQGTLIKKN